MTRWENWQKSHINEIMRANKGRKKYNIAKKVLSAAKENHQYLVGIHEFANMDRVREILNDEEEWGVTRHLMSTILCENADPGDQDVIVEYNLGKRRYSENAKNISTDLFKVPFDRFYHYLEKINVEITDLLNLPSDLKIEEFRELVKDRQDLSMYIISVFETCFTSLALGDYDMKLKLERDCAEYWAIIPELLGELEAFNYITELLEKSMNEEVTERWFRIVRYHKWSEEKVRTQLLDIVSNTTDEVEKSDSAHRVGGYGKEYVLYGAINALECFPDDESVSSVLDSLLRLEENIFASSSLAELIRLSHAPLRLVLDNSVGQLSETDAMSDGGDNSHEDNLIQVRDGNSGDDLADRETIDKVAGVLCNLYMKERQVESVSSEVRVLFRDTVPKCSEKKFLRLVEYASTSIFTASNADELVKAVASRIHEGIDGLTTDDCLEIIRDSKMDLGFFIRALERIGGSEPRRYIEVLNSNLDAVIDSLIRGCIGSDKANVADDGDVSDWMRPAPDLKFLLGSTEKFGENLSEIVSIIKNNDHFKSEHSNKIYENLLSNYLESVEGKVVVLEAVHRSEKKISSIKANVIADLEDWGSQCRMVRFSLARASKQYIGEREVSSALLSALRTELKEKSDRQLLVQIGEILANSRHKEDLEELDIIIGKVNRKEALIWSMVMANNFAWDFSENVEKSLSWGLDMNSLTTCKILQILAGKDCSEETIAKVNGLIEKPSGNGNGKVHGYIKCCALRVIAQSKYDNPYPRLISMFKLGDMSEEIGKPIQHINGARESTHEIYASFSYTVSGSIVTPANFTQSLMFALSGNAKEELLENMDDAEPLVRYGCAATLAKSYTNLDDHKKVRPVIMEIERKGLLSEYGLKMG